MITASSLRDQISDLIISGVYSPGDKLDETILAERFGVSRTPVREALHQLSASGLVVMRPRRPATVRQLTDDQLASSFEALGELEALCAGYSAERMSRAERLGLQELMAAGDKICAAGDFAAYRDIDTEFHSLIHAGAHNDTLAAITQQLRMQLAPYSAAPYTISNATLQLDEPHTHHSAVCKAIVAHQRDAAHQVMLDHVGISGLTIRRILRESEPSRLAI